MTSPKESKPTTKSDELTPSSYLTTTTVDKDGNFGSEIIDITQVPDNLLFQYVAGGDERAAAELLARMAKFEEEQGIAEPEPATEESP